MEFSMYDILRGVTLKTHHREVLGSRSVNPELGRPRQGDWRFQASLSYKSRLSKTESQQ